MSSFYVRFSVLQIPPYKQPQMMTTESKVLGKFFVL
jgi:hypothetical protein